MTTTIIPTITELPTTNQGQKAWQIQWANMANGNVGGEIDLTDYSDRSVQVEGTFGSGGTCVIQGTNDLTNWETLRDPSSTSLSLNSAGIHGILELTAQIRPNITEGDSTTSLTVTLVVRRTWR